MTDFWCDLRKLRDWRLPSEYDEDSRRTCRRKSFLIMKTKSPCDKLVLVLYFIERL
jgi:hypothetical protein